MPLSVLRGERRPGERWTEHDTTLALALTLHEDTLCSGCRQPLQDSTSEDADPALLDTVPYVVPPPTRCHACTALDEASEVYADAHAPAALRFHVIREEADSVL